jgi:hypothetical protein
MSGIDRQSVKSMIQTGDSSSFDGSSILDTVHAVKTVEVTGSEGVCESPLCDVRFPQTGLKIEPRRFCCGECRQQASLLRRVAILLEGFSPEAAHEILTRARNK